MVDVNKGSKGRDLLLTRKEAAEWLSLPTRAIRSLVTQGLLHPAKRHGGKTWFWSSDVASVAKCLHRDMDLATTAQHALQALATAQRAERELRGVLDLLQAKYEPLSVEPEDIEEVYDAVGFVLQSSGEELTAEQVQGWARLLTRVNRGYLLLVSLLTGSKEPWAPLLQLADKLLEEAPRYRLANNPQLAFAYGLLEGARRGLREEAYLFCRDKYGERIAENRFPEVRGRSVNEVVLSLLR